jgi:hypothetical protein
MATSIFPGAGNDGAMLFDVFIILPLEDGVIKLL